MKVNEKKGERTFMYTNMSSFTYRLRRGKLVYELEPFKSLIFTLGKNKKTGEYLAPQFTVENMWHMDFKHPVIELEIDNK